MDNRPADPAFRRFRREGPRRYRAFAAVGLLFAVTLGATIWGWTDQNGFDARKQRATATITATHPGRNSSTADVRFEAGGRTWTANLSRTRGAVGSAIEVYYDPEDPTTATPLDASLHGRLLVFTTTGAGFTGLLLLVFAVLSVHNRRVERGEWLRGTATALGPHGLRVDLRDGTRLDGLRLRFPLPAGFTRGEVAVQRAWGKRWLYVLDAHPDRILMAVEAGRPPR
ncbi:DUF3592 domain-containing protein [Actinokineospora bangkokensis]|uniref:DUF3592 domain-containing protein n=1 Tax=Actinokineospora bangkokensis TaxID=1193682 RepID=A0A1Q9LEZ4_9PSEU|nr:DUF3592 domain-containing protein [Actinokineospora bangkokensis]OLR90611.1 hypothetical protein BJP25_28785 [Actinokineospora bangkokensis]